MSSIIVRKVEQYQIAPEDGMLYRYDANVELPSGAQVRLHLIGNVEVDDVIGIIMYGRMLELGAKPKNPPSIPEGVRGDFLL